MKKTALIIGIALSTLFTSCKKVKGCMDKDSINYNSSAEQDDGSCRYSGTMILWYGKDVSDYLLNNGSTSLVFFINGEIAGSSASNIYYSSAPSCGENGTITIEKDLGFDKSKSYTYKVINQSDDIIWSGTLNFQANTCVATELTL